MQAILDGGEGNHGEAAALLRAAIERIEIVADGERVTADLTAIWPAFSRWQRTAGSGWRAPRSSEG